MDCSNKDRLIKDIANAVGNYAIAYGLVVSEEANNLWDLVEPHMTKLPGLFSVATNEIDDNTSKKVI